MNGEIKSSGELLAGYYQNLNKLNPEAGDNLKNHLIFHFKNGGMGIDFDFSAAIKEIPPSVLWQCIKLIEAEISRRPKVA